MPPPRACSKTTDLNHRLHGCHGLGSARGNGIPEIEGKGAQCGAEQGGSHASLTVHRNEILFYSGSQEHRKCSHGLLFRERRVPAFFIVSISTRTIRVIRGFPPIHDSTIYAVKARGAHGALRAQPWRSHSWPFVVQRNQLDCELRRSDKGNVGKNSPERESGLQLPSGRAKSTARAMNKLAGRSVLDIKQNGVP